MLQLGKAASNKSPFPQTRWENGNRQYIEDCVIAAKMDKFDSL